MSQGSLFRGSLSRRRVFQVFGAAAAGAVVTACAGPGSTSGGDEPSAVDTTGPVEGELSFAHWRAED